MIIFRNSEIFVDPYFSMMEPIKEDKFRRWCKIPKSLIHYLESFQDVNKQSCGLSFVHLFFIEECVLLLFDVIA